MGPDLEIKVSGLASITLFCTSKFFSNSLPPTIEVSGILGYLSKYFLALSAAPLAV